MLVLVACEFSGIVRDAFRRHGHDAWSCDFLESESDAEHHIQGNALDHLDWGWDLMIAHPPCTYLTNAGVRWLHMNGKGSDPDPVRWNEMEIAAQFFNDIMDCDIPKICVENPTMHSYARALITSSHAQRIQPWMFGHDETKATYLWLKNLPKLQPTNVIAPDFEKYPKRIQISKETGDVVQGRGSGYATNIIGGTSNSGYNPRVHMASPGPERWKERSRTYTGIAEAMASQWGSL